MKRDEGGNHEREEESERLKQKACISEISLDSCLALRMRLFN